jgi:hypothetical protein
MALVANDPKAAKRLDIPKSVGEEFMKADKGKKFGSGGALKATDSSENPGLSKLPTEVRNKMGYMKKGGMAMKKGMKEGGMADMAQDKKMAKKAIGMHDKQMHGGKKTDLAALKKGGKVSPKFVKEMEKAYPKGATVTPMKKGGMAKGCGYSKGGQLAKANGVAVRGKTKGKIC